MLTAKLKLIDENAVFAPKAKKHKLKLVGYPLNYYRKGNDFYFRLLGLAYGKEEGKTKFFKELDEDKGVVKLEIEDNLFLCVTSETETKNLERKVNVFYDPSILHIKPVIISPDGWEEWEIASFEKDAIENLVRVAKEKYKGELLEPIQERKVRNISVLAFSKELKY